LPLRQANQATSARTFDTLPKRDQEALLRTIDAFISKTA
jgi:hypothetical protein